LSFQDDATVFPSFPLFHRRLDRAALRLAQLTLATAWLLGAQMVHAQASAAAPVAVPAQPGAMSLLAGKLRFALPPGFDRTALPPGGEFGEGAIHVDRQTRQVMLITEAPIAGGVQVGDDDPGVLDAALAAHLLELDKPSPNYRRLGEQSLSIKGLGLRRSDGTTRFFDQRVHSTSLLAASGGTLATLIMVTPIDDTAGHQALVARVLAEIDAMR
jgi:hypothetical protein